MLSKNLKHLCRGNHESPAQSVQPAFRAAARLSSNSRRPFPGLEIESMVHHKPNLKCTQNKCGMTGRIYQGQLDLEFCPSQTLEMLSLFILIALQAMGGHDTSDRT